jgi:hypothetical protein
MCQASKVLSRKFFKISFQILKSDTTITIKSITASLVVVDKSPCFVPIPLFVVSMWMAHPPGTHFIGTCAVGRSRAGAGFRPNLSRLSQSATGFLRLSTAPYLLLPGLGQDSISHLPLFTKHNLSKILPNLDINHNINPNTIRTGL